MPADDLVSTMEPPPHAPHRWKFFRAGGFDQVRLDSAADLLALKALDPKLWVALSVPTRDIEFPAVTLSCLDTDHDGHIRRPELLAAIDWCAARLKGLDLLCAGPSALPLDAIDEQSEAGRRVLASARRILGNLGRPEATAIDADAFADPALIFGHTAFNGDGVITALSTDDPTLQAAIAAAGDLFGYKPDRSGERGVDRDAIDALFGLARQQRDWFEARPAFASCDRALPMAESTARLSSKIDDYFTRCQLAAYEPRATEFVNGSGPELDAIGRASLAAPPPALVALPLARVEAGRPLPLADGVNPAWAAELADWRVQALPQLLGRSTDELKELDAAAWGEARRRAQPLLDWLATRPALPAGLPDTATLAAWLAGGVEARLLALVDADLALAEEAAGVDEVRQLVFYVRDLARFATNFVNFREFYAAKDAAGQTRANAVFQSGTLYLDGRSCELVVPVDEVGKHAALATLSRLYLVYCDCRRGELKRTIAAALTDGDSDQLLVGRNGVFVDRSGADWDATVVRLVEHPISLRQAFWAPWRRLSRMIGEQLQKLAASKEQAVEKKSAGIAEATAKGPAPADPKAPPAPFDVAKFAGIFAAIGLAIGAIGTVIASLVGGLVSLKWWQMPLALVGLLLVVSGPSMVIAWFKLRNRTLGPLLDANGWAINARAVINLPFGQSLTQLARLPENAERALVDPYADKPQPWGIYFVLAVLIGVGLYFLVRLSAQ